jgi:hypothetical protein
MDDGVNADDGALDRGAIRDVAHVQIVRAWRRPQIKGPEREVRLETVKNSLPNIPGRTGDEDELG